MAYRRAERQLRTKETLNMRTVEYHKINPVNDTLDVNVIDEPGAGGANHVYRVEPRNSAGCEALDVKFQNGPIGEVGVNGVTQEVLLAIVIDRLRSFQAGPFSSRENALALTKCEEALHWLQQRTIDRMRRGVEGTNKA
jgi:hypothetical protein